MANLASLKRFSKCFFIRTNNNNHRPRTARWRPEAGAILIHLHPFDVDPALAIAGHYEPSVPEVVGPPY